MAIMELPPAAIDFTVFGIPATKGNKSGFALKRGGQFTGKVALREGKSENFRNWTRRVEEVVQGLARRGAPLLDGPLKATVTFYLPKPISAPKRRRTCPDRRPDLGKLLRAIEDPMNGVLIADDARFVDIHMRKVYAEDATPYDPRPRAEVLVWRVEDLQPRAKGRG